MPLPPYADSETNNERERVLLNFAGSKSESSVTIVFYSCTSNHRLSEDCRAVIEALIHAHREDLIGYGPDCLVAPDSEYIRTHPRKPAATSKATNQKAGSARSKAPAHRSRRGSVVTRDGVLTNDTRSPRQKRR